MQPETIKPLFYAFADFRVDAEKRLLWRNREQIQLTPKVFDLLLTFLEHRGEVLEKDFLMNLLWADSFVEESNLAQNVAVLRKALGENPKQHKFILTVPGRGYRFVAEVKEIFESEISAMENNVILESELEKLNLSVAAGVSNIEKPVVQITSLKWIVITVPLILIAVGAFAFWFFSNRDNRNVAFEIKQSVVLTSWSDLEFFPAISPDGNTIAFSSDHTGNFEIYVKQIISGTREVQLTSDGGENFEPAFSPDGNQIAYYSKKRNGIWIVPITGGKPKQLTEFGSRPAFSPDGASVVFQSDPLIDLGTDARPAMPPSALWIIPTSGGEPKQITQAGNPPGGHGAPSFSPDGRRIVFTANDTISSAIWTISADGGDLKPIALDGRDLKQSYETAWDAVFAPDGKSILAFSGKTLLKINVSESGEMLGEPINTFISSGSRLRHLSVSQKSKRIVYSALQINSNIWSTPLAPGTSEAIGSPVQYTLNADARSIQPAFSPDGKKIAFQSIDSTGTATQIWTMDADGKNQAQLTTGGAINPRWFSDSSRIAFLTRRENKFQFWSVTAEGGKEKKIFEFGQDATQARISPDGKSVVFNSKEGRTLNIWTVPIEGGAAKQLTFDKELAGFPAWSPDGKWLALQIKRGEDTHVAVMPSEGGEPVQLTFDKGQSWIYDWSPDGDKIVFAGQRDGLWNIYWISRSTKVQKQLTNFTKLNSYARYPAWSPLNNQIVYEYAETTGNIWMIELK